MPPQKTQKKSAETILDKIIKGHLYALIILLPLLFWWDFATIFALPKLLGLHLISISALFFVFLKTFLERRLRLPATKALILLGLWTLSLLLSTVFSLDQITSLYGQYTRFMGLFTFLNLLLVPVYLMSFFDRSEFRRLLVVSVLTATVVAIYGLLQYFDFFGLWPKDFRWTDPPQNRVFATMGHANHLGAYLTTNFMFLTYLWHRKDFSKTWIAMAAITIPSLLMAACLLLTASRGAVLAFFLVYLILLIVRVIKNYHQIKKKLWFLVATTIVILATAYGSIWVFIDNLDSLGLIARTEQTIASMEKGIVPERLSFLYSSWQMFVDHPLVGTGLSTFRDSYSAYRRTDYVIDGPGNAQYITVPESAHNEYANILATQGLFGFLTFLALLIYLIVILLQRYFSPRTAAPEDHWQLVLLGGILVFAVQILFNFGEIVNWFIFFLLVAIVMADQPKSWHKTFNLPLTPLIIAVPVMFLVIGWLTMYGVFLPAQADYYLRLAREAVSERDLASADQYYQVSIAGQPLEYELYQEYADFSISYATAGDIDDQQTRLQQAVKNYRQAILLNPNYPSTYHNLALAYLKLFRLSKNNHYGDLSRENFQKSVDKAVNNPRYPYEFARKLHTDWNDREGAVKLLLQALQIAPNYQEPQDYLDFLYSNHPELKNTAGIE